MQKQIKRILKNVYVDKLKIASLQTWRTTLWYFKRKFGRIDRGIIETYVDCNAIRKLHIGCGGTTIDGISTINANIIEGWLNADLFPLSSSILHLDATKKFPIGDEEIDYIFSEHMIEHISYSQGLAMLAECFRVLKNGGKIRLSTPDLAFLIDIYKAEKSDLQKAYIKWAREWHNEMPYCDEVFLINNFVREWGHQFIYDEKTLRASMEKAGFSQIARCELNESTDQALRGLERENRMPDGFLKLETFTLEGTKSSFN